MEPGFVMNLPNKSERCRLPQYVTCHIVSEKSDMLPDTAVIHVVHATCEPPPFGMIASFATRCPSSSPWVFRYLPNLDCRYRIVLSSLPEVPEGQYRGVVMARDKSPLIWEASRT